MDVNAILSSIMGSTGAGIDKAVTAAKSSSIPGGVVGGVAAGGLTALLLSNKKARKMGTKAIKYGGMAALGGLAYKAWSDYKDNQPVPAAASSSSPATPTTQSLPQAPSGSIFDLAEAKPSDTGQDFRLSLIRAMISAAKSDGHIDTTERARIEQQISDLGIGPEEQRFLVDELNAPSDPITIARLSGCEEQAAEIYLASRLAVDLDTPEEHRYLERLGDALHLPDALRQHLEQQASSVGS